MQSRALAAGGAHGAHAKNEGVYVEASSAIAHSPFSAFLWKIRRLLRRFGGSILGVQMSVGQMWNSAMLSNAILVYVASLPQV